MEQETQISIVTDGVGLRQRGTREGAYCEVRDGRGESAQSAADEMIHSNLGARLQMKIHAHVAGHFLGCDFCPLLTDTLK
jgi:hypothetical protein